ncbi:MAG: anhydro-N-acetylmuramic acid kinase [Pseudomonadota bacterium]
MDNAISGVISEREPIWAAGFMSGTSLDAVDAAMVLTDGHRVLDWGPVAERKYTGEERAVLQAAVDAARAWQWEGDAPEGAFSAARAVLTRTHTDAFAALCAAPGAPVPLLAGVHGQTVLHRRPQFDGPGGGAVGATLQIIDAVVLRTAFGVPLVYDFRSADVAAGGEGAPLAPAYHGALLEGLGLEERGCGAVVLNLGGVANITARTAEGGLVAFDTGPANGPIDEWVLGHGHGTHDAGGRLAAAGTVHHDRLEALLGHAWFDQPPPKSLDRYDFGAGMVSGLSLEDGAATLTAFTARAVAAGLAQLSDRPSKVVACGGGRHNPVLMAELNAVCPCPVVAAEAVGWRGDSIEAEAFAFLAVRSVRGLPISWPTTTGVPGAMSGGRVLA